MLLEVGLEDIRLLVSRPPQTLEAAQRIAAELVVFADEAHKGLRRVSDIARRRYLGHRRKFELCFEG